MQKPNRLAPRPKADLSFLSKGGAFPVEKGAPVDKVEEVKKVAKAAPVEEAFPVEEIAPVAKVKPVNFNLPIRPETVARLYSEVFHDPDKRPLYLILNEILDAGLAHRPFKGPPSPTFMARVGARGKRAKKP